MVHLDTTLRCEVRFNSIFHLSLTHIHPRTRTQNAQACQNNDMAFVIQQAMATAWPPATLLRATSRLAPHHGHNELLADQIP